MNNFSGLLRNSFFISLQNNQILKSQNTNFGLKQNLRKFLVKHRFNEPIKHGKFEYEFIRRRLELGIYGAIPKNEILKNNYHFNAEDSTQKLTKKPIEDWNSAEFKAWIDHAKSKKEEFKSRGLHENDFQEFLDLNLQKKTPVYPPNYTTGESKVVKGRIIGVRGNSLLVGVQGLVCVLPSNEIPQQFQELRKYFYRGNIRIDMNKEYDFTVVESEPEIKLSLQKKRNIDTLFMKKSEQNDLILDKIMTMIKSK